MVSCIGVIAYCGGSSYSQKGMTSTIYMTSSETMVELLVDKTFQDCTIPCLVNACCGFPSRSFIKENKGEYMNSIDQCNCAIVFINRLLKLKFN